MTKMMVSPLMIHQSSSILSPSVVKKKIMTKRCLTQAEAHKQETGVKAEEGELELGTSGEKMHTSGLAATLNILCQQGTFANPIPVSPRRHLTDLGAVTNHAGGKGPSIATEKWPKVNFRNGVVDPTAPQVLDVECNVQNDLPRWTWSVFILFIAQAHKTATHVRYVWPLMCASLLVYIYSHPVHYTGENVLRECCCWHLQFLGH